MAKFKPHRVPVLLEGGPCDGVKTTAVRGIDLLHSVTCRGVIYDPTDRVTRDNRVVYTPRASQHQPPPPTPGAVASPSKAHHAWHGMLKTIFVHVPKELQRSARARHAMRHLMRRRGLR